MSNLGGNSPSEDTDRSNNLQGDKGDTGATGATGAQGDQGIQGEQGDEGEAGSGTVATVVGGTNCSVDAADAANPIVNADTQVTNTTKGDIEGYSTVAERIPVGTNDDVLTADSTADLGVAWKTPAAGGDVATDTIFDAKGDLAGGTGSDTAARLAVGTDDFVLTADAAEATGMKWAAASGGGGGAPVTMFTQKFNTPDSFSPTAVATKGAVWVMSSDLLLESIVIATGGNATATYKLMICEVSGSTHIIDVILYDSAVSAAESTNNYRTFVPSGGVTLLSGKTIAIIIVRTDGTGTSVCQISHQGDLQVAVGIMTPSGSLRFAGTNPVVTTALGTIVSATTSINARLGVRI